MTIFFFKDKNEKKKKNMAEEKEQKFIISPSFFFLCVSEWETSGHLLKKTFNNKNKEKLGQQNGLKNELVKKIAHPVFF